MKKNFYQKTKCHWPGDSFYFLTDSCYLHYPYFDEDEKKQIVLDRFKKIQEDLDIHVIDYSIAINHYHLMFFLKDGERLKDVKRFLRGGISYEYKARYEMEYNIMWSSRKTIVIYKDEVKYKISGYIIGNLLKHKECSTFKELLDCNYSSFKYKVDRYGFDVAREMVEAVIDVGEDEYGVVDINNLKSI